METLLRRHALATQHNFLIHAPLSLSHIEVIIFSLALACIHKNDEELPPISMRFTDVFESTSGSNYAALTKAMDSLVGKRVKMQSITTKRTQIEVYNIISSLKFDTNTGLITGKFSQDISPYLIALRKNFTSMEVEMLLTLKNAHTHRLAWFLKSYEYLQEVEISLVNLRKILFGEEPGYADYFEFKRKVLNPALAELNAPTGINWEIVMTEVKKGLRQVIALHFKIPELRTELVNELPNKKPRKSSGETTAAAKPTATPVPAAASECNMRLNKDEPAHLLQVMQAATAEPTRTAPATATGSCAYKIQKRMEKLQLTDKQIAKIQAYVGEDLAKFKKLFSGTQELLEAYESKSRVIPNIGAETLKQVMTLLPPLYHEPELRS